MGKNTKKIIIAAVVIAIIVILMVTGVLLYLLTDLFKSDQQLFYKYIAQNGEMISKYLEDPNKDNIKAINESKHSVKGNITFDLVSNDTEIANQMIPARNFSVEYKQQVDPVEKKDSTQTTLKFLDKDLFELKYAHDNDLYAITSAEVINKYLTFENNNLKALATKYGITDVTNIPDKIEIQDYSQVFTITEEEMAYILQNYGNIFNTQITKEDFYHNKGIITNIGDNQVKANCYGLNISKEDSKNIINTILNKLEEDNQILNAIVNRVKTVDSSIELTTQDLKDAISELIVEFEENAELQDITVEVYESEGKLVKLVIKSEDGSVGTITYETNENSIRAIISFEYNTVNSDNSEDGVSFVVKNIELARQTVLGQSNDVAIFTIDAGNDEEYTVSVQNKMYQDTQTQVDNSMIINVSDSETYFTIKVNSVITQSNDVVVEELTDANSAIINNFSSEYTASLIQAIGNRLQTLLTQKLTIISTAQLEANGQSTTEQNGTIIENN